MLEQPIEVFFSYSHKDEELRGEMAKHLSILKRQGVITGWHDRRITAGDEWAGQIDEHLNSAHLILLLVSADFIASDYCYDLELTRAMERHESGEARVIPVILRPCDWKGAPFGKLQGLPKDLKPVTSWPDRDEAFTNVAQGIRAAVEKIAPGRAVAQAVLPPPPAVGFVKRSQGGRDLVERLRAELAPEKSQLVVLWGEGGVGKTTLAREAAVAIEDRRLVWTSAEKRADFTLSTLLDEIASQLGRTELRQLAAEKKKGAVRELVAAQRPLIVLDNFETIATRPNDEQQACVEWLKHAACPALITTRQAIPGVRNIGIDEMSPGEANEYLARLINDAANQEYFAQLDRQLVIEAASANPLVMQWIVAQIDLYGQGQRRALEELRQGKGDAAERVFDRSFNLLGTDARDALLALALFVPSASRAALAEVAGLGADPDRANEAVKQLHSLRLVRNTRDGERLVIEGLTRQLAGARLVKEPNAHDFHVRFIACFLRYAESHKQRTAEDLDAMETEKDNALRAFDISRERGDWHSVCRLRAALEELLYVHGYWDEAILRGEQALEAARQLSDKRKTADFSHSVAIYYQRRGEIDEARKLYEKSLDIQRELGNQSGIAGLLHQLGTLAQDQGEMDEARRLYEQSLEISRKLGDQLGIAGSLHNLAMLAGSEGKVNKSRKLYEQSLEINRKLGNQSGIASSLHNLAIIAQDQGEIDEARKLYGQSLEILRKLGDQFGIAASLQELGRLAEGAGNKVEAARLFRESLSIFERLKSRDAKIARESLERVEGKSGS